MNLIRSIFARLDHSDNPLFQSASPGPGHDFPPLMRHRSLIAILNQIRAAGGPCVLVKIKINPASEVVRLCEDDGLYSESKLIDVLEGMLRREFSDGHIFKMEFNAYLMVLRGSYERLSERLKAFIQTNSPRTVQVNGSDYYPKFLAGVTTVSDNFGETLSRLEFAMRQAIGKAGTNLWFVSESDPEFQNYVSRRAGLRDVRKALSNSELGLYAQPIVSVRGKAGLPKYEILLRHYASRLEALPPGAILSHAAFNKISQEIDLYVAELICRNFHRLFGQSGNQIDALSINISGPSFATPNFNKALSDIVSAYNVPRQKLILEITEDIAANTSYEALLAMENFRDSGFRLALDDVGIGSSNFNSLRNYPVDFFKIDRSYCEALLEDSATRAYVKLIIDVGKASGKQIIAEGVPNDETLSVLCEMGIDFSQSYITGMPEEIIPAPLYG